MNHTTSIVLLIVLLVLLLGMLPAWPYMGTLGWGYYPSGFSLLLILVVIIGLFGTPRGRLQ